MSSPTVNCVSVETNGDVTLTWTAPSDPSGEFVQYNVMESSSLGGPYSNAGTLTNIGTTTYLYSGTNANVTPLFFYVTVTSSDGTTSVASDTVRTIFLVISSLNQGGIASLQWSPVSSPLLASSSSTYNVYRDYPTSAFSILGTTADTKYKDTITICTANFNYYVEISDNSGCTSKSNVVGGVFHDKTSPDPPTIDSVTVQNGQTVIGLSPSVSPDAQGYVVYQGFSGGSQNTYISKDTIWSNAGMTYTVTGSSPNSGSELYAVASIDSCGNVSNIVGDQKTIFLNETYNLCQASVLLGWTRYINMINGVNKYELFVSLDGTNYSFYDDTTGLAYNVKNLLPNQTYYFYVRAVDSTRAYSSTSNVITFTSSSHTNPSYVYVKSVSVNTAQQIEVGVQVDTSASLKGIEVYKADSATGVFSPIAYVGYNGSPSYYITDTDVDPSTKIYYYKAVVIDSCGLEGIESNISNSVWLGVTSNSNYTNTLRWTNYKIYYGGLAAWNIYRSINDVFDSSPIATVAGNVYTYTDDVSFYMADQGRFDYYVQAVEGNGNPYDLQELSNSNIVVAYDTDSIFIPNAFKPKGVNTVWLPITQYVEKTDYRVSVYDRWGEKIWETQSDSEGWDGGHFPGGIYAYNIEYKNAYGEYKRYTGTIFMIK